MDETWQALLPERVTFFDGQRLAAADLGAGLAAERELRWLHNRTLHTWGVVLGLGVTAAQGDREVRVAAGYALDDLGRELILREPVALPVPPVAGGAGGAEADFFLVLSYAPDDPARPAETRAGVCLPGGPIRLPDAPVLAWRRAADGVAGGREIVLARVYLQNCRLSRPVSTTARRDARPARQPYIAGGRSPAALLAWDYLTDPHTGERVGLRTPVDTGAGRFRQTPAYTARVGGGRDAGGGRLVDGTAVVANPTPVGFELRVLLPRDLHAGSVVVNPGTLFQGTTLTDLVRDQLKWSVEWFGVEG